MAAFPRTGYQIVRASGLDFSIGRIRVISFLRAGNQRSSSDLGTGSKAVAWKR